MMNNTHPKPTINPPAPININTNAININSAISPKVIIIIYLLHKEAGKNREKIRGPFDPLILQLTRSVLLSLLS